MTDADVKAQLDERRVARAAAIGIPLVTIVLALGCGAVLGAPTAILVLAAGTLLGVIALLWASLRVLSGDVALPPEIEALDMTAHGIDALASRKKMLLVALKDLEAEHALGKLDDEDYGEVSKTYRAELKDVMMRIDASLEPFRDKAEQAAREHLANAGVLARGYRGEQPVPDAPPAAKDAGASTPARVTCASCQASNETDAKFCKGCGATLAARATDATAKDEAADDS